jgi:protein-tyrosine phosphatase
MAQVIFEKLVEDAKLSDNFYIDSAGTHASDGHSPPHQTKNAVKTHGLKMDHLLSRQISLHDFLFYDYIIAMDQDNMANLMSICPKAQQRKISLLSSYAPQLESLDIPDPYQGGEKGFDIVYETILRCSTGLLNKIRQERELS